MVWTIGVPQEIIVAPLKCGIDNENARHVIVRVDSENRILEMTYGPGICPWIE